MVAQISETKQSSFSYLANPIQYLSAQSNNQGTNPATGSAPSGAVTAALSSAQHNLAHHLPSAATSLLATYAGTSQKRNQEEDLSASTQFAEQQGPDLRDVERILGECTALSSRWALYRRFVFDRMLVSGVHFRAIRALTQ
jgi:putative salt-induced outer membrane protein YdiY